MLPQEYEEYLKRNLSIIEKATAALSGVDERIDYTNILLTKLVEQAGISIPPTHLPLYNVYSVKLDTALTDKEIQLPGDGYAVGTDGVLTYMTFKLDSPTNDSFPLDTFPVLSGISFKKLYFTSLAQSGKTLHIFIARAGQVTASESSSFIHTFQEIEYSIAIDTAATSTEVLAANWRRKYALISNDSDTVIYLALGEDAAVNEGIRLNANGGSYEINWTNRFTGVINGIHTGVGNKVLCVIEGV